MRGSNLGGNMAKLIVPVDPKKNAFNCAFCDAYAQQAWLMCFVSNDSDPNPKLLCNPLSNKSSHPQVSGQTGAISCSECQACGFVSLWIGGHQIFPGSSKEIAKPNEDMPEDIKEVYIEAADIFSRSPRSAAALLRVCLEKLLIKLEIKGHNLNEKIGNSNFPDKILKAADAVRLFGNDAVHPGEIRFDEDTTIVPTLFLLINYVVEKQITSPNLAEDIYNKLTDSQKEQIKNRNTDKSSHNTNNGNKNE